jgi:hypothetical protein
MAKKFIRNFFIGAVLLLLLCMFTVVLFDPFFQYHKPLPGLKAVLTEKEYQCPGSLKNFDYDSVIAGSSVSENYNNRWFDEGFDCTSIKAIRSYGATADLCWLLDIAFQNHELKYVFYNLDPSSLSADPVTTFESTGCPMYLYDNNYFNDIQYLLNKDVLFERIPYLIAQSLFGDYDEGNSYNWAQWKSFNSDMILGLYIRKKSVSDMKEADYYEDVLSGNLALLCEEIEAHPETEFKISIPPYSMLWWDNIYRNGDTESYLYNLETAMETLLSYDNVELYYFLNDREIVTDLDNYMDILHFSPEINEYICDSMIEGSHRVTEETCAQVISDSRDFAYEVINELILPYEDRILVDIYD